jgi:hypothetical protein
VKGRVTTRVVVCEYFPQCEQTNRGKVLCMVSLLAHGIGEALRGRKRSLAEPQRNHVAVLGLGTLLKLG